MADTNDVTTTIDVPQEVVSRIRLNRFSDIFGRMMVASVVIALILCGIVILLPMMYGMVSIVVSLVLLLVMGGIIIFTFGTAFLIEDGPLSYLWQMLSDIGNSSEVILKVVDMVSVVMPITCGIGIAMSLLNVLFVILGKSNKKTSKIVVSLACVVVLVICILIRVLGGALWVG